MTDFGGKTSIFSHPVYLFLRKFSLQDSRGGSVRARIDEDLKNQAADVLAGMGLTISDLVRITLTKVAREKALPFDLREPNQLTIQSIKNSEAGVDVHKAKDADDLFDKLGI